jgi:uncharacterized protein (DUF2267 family)
MANRSEALSSRVAAHAGVSSPLADYALRAVLAGIGGYLSPAFRQLIAEELPDALASAVASGNGDRRPIEERVQLTGMTKTQTHELLTSVCRVLTEELSSEAVRAIVGAVPPAIGAMFVPSSPGVPPRSPRRRQADSVNEPNPHAETKLSSAPGTSQERELETLATWRGTRHRMSEPN